MKVLAFFNSKGGSGKSTMAMHVAVAAAEKLRVVILDADPNGTTTVWSGARESEVPAVEPTSSVILRTHLSRLEKQGVQLVVLDCPPTITAESAFLVSCADLVVVPVQPTMPDVAGCFNATRIIDAQGKPYIFIMSRCPPPSQEVRESLEALSAASTVCPIMIGDRIAFSRALKLGLAVTEYGKDTKADDEVTQACNWILKKIGVEHE